MNRQQILSQAAVLISESRQATYGPPEIQLECAQELKNVLRRYAALMRSVVTCRDIPPAEWECLEQDCQKLSRIVCGPLYHPDNYVDLCGYTGIAGEIAARATRLEDQATETDDGPE